ncbi:MAG TPA: SGNH/GDSL hydrolase family protein [Bryobacteraceae bacterium]|jgi:lysophospholipase L1-like esterase|nr:SGNH/GDSL hydrolase family protein [Bryobacteraceae bacterium]
MPPSPGLSDSTLRQIVHVSIGGSRLRIRISNAFGDKPLSILSVHVAVSLGLSRISVPSDKAVTFNGRGSVIIPEGAPIESDPVAFPLAPLSNLAITMHVADSSSAVTAHPGSRETSYLQADDAVSAPQLPSAVQTVHWYFVNGVDVTGPAGSASVAALGDSITDGRGSTTDGNDRWPDELARRLRTDKNTADIGVLNEGVGGNRLLQDGLGPNALARLDRDVLAQTAVRWLIVLEGINDIGTASGNAEDIIGAYNQLILRAHAHGIRVYGGTILPYEGAAYFSPTGEAIRQKVNEWIRSSGKFDAVIDWDKVMRDREHPLRLAAAVDSGDHLHPSAAGYEKLANAIDLRLFEER